MPIVFSDIDYTIVFDGVLQADTARLLRRVRSRAHFVLVTARSRRECKSLPHIPNDGLIVENAAGFHVEKDGHRQLDRQWDRLMANRREVLDDFARRLQQRGWQVINKRRSLSSGIDISDMSKDEVNWVEENLPEGLQLDYSRNTRGRYIEVFPMEAGKDKAVKRVSSRLAIPKTDTFGMGDNSNDLAMLREVNIPLAPANCDPKVGQFINSRGGYVSPLESHDGARDILRKLLELLPAP